jgi:hypothetical protein
VPLPNRVTPWGEIIAVPERGRWFGNRGCLHDAAGRLRRDHAGRRWIFCALAFKGRRRPLLRPGHYTELFFLDEATALAAGHRPCAECLRPRFEHFRELWARANPGLAAGQPRPLASRLDLALHTDRLGPDGRRRTRRAPVGALPRGAMFRLDADAMLVTEQGLWRWSPGGYTPALPLPPETTVAVLTPPSILRTLALGYQPDLHPSAA